MTFHYMRIIKVYRVKQIKKQGTHWKKIFIRYKTNKGLASQIYKKFQMNKEKSNRKMNQVYKPTQTETNAPINRFLLSCIKEV